MIQWHFIQLIFPPKDILSSELFIQWTFHPMVFSSNGHFNLCTFHPKAILSFDNFLWLYDSLSTWLKLTKIWNLVKFILFLHLMIQNNWRTKCVVDEKYIGWKVHWIKSPLDEKSIGWKVHWMKCLLEEKLIGPNVTGSNVSGFNVFWIKSLGWIVLDELSIWIISIDTQWLTLTRKFELAF